MNRIYLSSGCIYNRKTGCDLRLLAECTQRLPISGIELMVIRQWYDDIEGLVARVSELRICVSLLHIEKTVGEHLSQERNAEAMQALEKNLIVAGKLAVRKAVLHLWHGQGSDRNLTNNIEGLGPMRELAAEYGTELLVENIPCENTDEVQLLLRIAARYREQKFVFDTKNAAFCDHMAPAVLEQVFGQVGTGATTVPLVAQVNEIDLDGSLILPPGAFVAVYSFAANTACALLSFLWEEVPRP